MTKSSAIRPPARRRVAAFGLAGALTVATLVLLLAPSTLGASTNHAIVLSAPYRGVTTGTSSTLSTTGCGNAANPVVPFFSGATGMGGFANHAAAPGCTNNPSGSSAYATQGFTSNIPLSLSSSNATIVALATVTAAGVTKLVPGVCGASNASSSYQFCYQSAEAYVTGYAYVIDQTTGAYFGSTTYWAGLYASQYYETYCFSFNGTSGCSVFSSGNTTATGFHSSTTFSWTFAVTGVNPSDKLVLQISFSGASFAYQYVYGTTLTGGTTRAGTNVGSGVNGIELDSITIV